MTSSIFTGEVLVELREKIIYFINKVEIKVETAFGSGKFQVSDLVFSASNEDFIKLSP